jgi:hypothetical protein
MQLRSQIALIIGLAVVVWMISLLLFGEHPTLNMLGPFGATVTIVTSASLLFVKYGWCSPILRGWLVQRPDLRGTWKCHLNSNFVDDRGTPIEKVAYVVIRQTLTSLSFRLYTERARSASIADNIDRDGSDLFRLVIAYQNNPQIEYRDRREEIHYGSALFTHIDYQSNRIEGHYWTDRNTKGSLVLLERRGAQVTSFEEARSLFTQAKA